MIFLSLQDIKAKEWEYEITMSSVVEIDKFHQKESKDLFPKLILMIL